jgi:hypothetical protein
MNENKQIEEIAKDLCHLTCTCEECGKVAEVSKHKCKAKVYARRAYEADYRKQSKGEWIVESEHSIRCSECCFNRAAIKMPLDYCPNCGANMKKE